MRKETALASMFTGMLFWGFANPFSDIAMSYFTPAQTYFLEASAGMVAFTFIVASVPRLRKNIGKVPWRLSIPLGLVMPGLCFYLGNIGYMYGTVTIGTILLATEVIFTALGGMFILGEKLSTKSFMAILMGLVGVLIVGINGQAHNPEAAGRVVTILGNDYSAGLVGALAFILSAFFSGLYAVYVRKYAADVDPIGLTLGQLVTAASIGIIWFIFSGIDAQYFYDNSTPTLAAIMAGFLGSGFAFLLFNTASEKVSTRETAMLLNTIPVVGIVAGALLGRGIPTVVQILGGAFVLGSLFFLETEIDDSV